MVYLHVFSRQKSVEINWIKRQTNGTDNELNLKENNLKNLFKINFYS